MVSKIDEVGAKAKETAPVQAATTSVKEGVDKISNVIGSFVSSILCCIRIFSQRDIDQVKAETKVFIRTKAETDTVLAQALILGEGLLQEQRERDAAALANAFQQPVAAATI